MKIAISSDLHLDQNEELLGKSLLPEVIRHFQSLDADVIIIAGDIANGIDQSQAYVDAIKKEINQTLLFVPGNHDIWSDRDFEMDSWEYYFRLSHDPSCLIGSPFELSDDWVVIGDLGWYDYTLGPAHIEESVFAQKKRKLWDDARFAKWGMSDREVTDRFLLKVEHQIQQYTHKKIIFVNHFIPRKEFALTKEGNANWNFCNAYMGSSRIEDMIEKYRNIQYVVFGHHHVRFPHTTFNDKTYICNPLGYTHEWKSKDVQKELSLATSVFKL